MRRWLSAVAACAAAAIPALVLGAGSARAEAPTSITITKSVVGTFDVGSATFGTAPAYYKAGDTITYRYELTGTDAFDVNSVTDDKCSPVNPVLAPGKSWNVGDTGYFSGGSYHLGDGDGVLNAAAGEHWVYYCTLVAPAVNPSNDIYDTATVNVHQHFSPFGAYSDTDTYKLEAVVLRKQVVLFWDYVHSVTAPGTGTVSFPIDVRNNGVSVGSETVTANTPLGLYLPEGGPWSLVEGTPPDGYTVARGDWTIGTLPANADRLDNTFFDVAPFDLAITKQTTQYHQVEWGPVGYVYDVSNSGPGSPVPVVTDDTCSPVTLASPSGDTNGDGFIQEGETWHFQCSTTLDWASAFPDPVTNTATVAAQKPAWTPAFGGDTNAANDTSSATLYPFVLRKDVQLYDNGSYLPFTDNAAFNVKAYLNGTQKGSFTISENSPKYLWLAAGTWKFQEYGLVSGYFPFYSDSGAITVTLPDSTYPDWTEINVTWSGCGFSHGYWKNHTPWPGGFEPTDTLTSVGFVASEIPSATTLLDALQFPGGSGLAGGQRILLRAAVGMLLNEAKYGPAFGPYTSTAALISAVDSALADRGTAIALADSLQQWNGGVCR